MAHLAELLVAHSDRVPLALLVVHLDRWSTIDRLFGREAGRLVHRRVVELVQLECHRNEHLLVPAEIQDLVVLAPGTSRASAVALGAGWRALIEDHVFAVAEVSIPVTVSVGVAVATRDDVASISALVDQAMGAVAKARTAGGNRVELSNLP